MTRSCFQGRVLLTFVMQRFVGIDLVPRAATMSEHMASLKNVLLSNSRSTSARQ